MPGWPLGGDGSIPSNNPDFGAGIPHCVYHFGAIVQLIERRTCNAKVVGLSPTSSTGVNYANIYFEKFG